MEHSKQNSTQKHHELIQKNEKHVSWKSTQKSCSSGVNGQIQPREDTITLISIIPAKIKSKYAPPQGLHSSPNTIGPQRGTFQVTLIPQLFSNPQWIVWRPGLCPQCWRPWEYTEGDN